MAVNRTLVTGGAGFIGSHICDSLLEIGDEVVCIDDLSTGSMENISHLSNNPKFRFVDIDINDSSRLLEELDGVSRVSHQAAIGSVPRSVKDPSAHLFMGIIRIYRKSRRRPEKHCRPMPYQSQSERI